MDAGSDHMKLNMDWRHTNDFSVAKTCALA